MYFFGHDYDYENVGSIQSGQKFCLDPERARGGYVVHHLTMKFCIYPQDAFRTRL